MILSVKKKRHVATNATVSVALKTKLEGLGTSHFKNVQTSRHKNK
jgi:hypothetical protein